MNDCAEGLGPKASEIEIEALITQVIIHNQEGSLTRIVSDESISELACGDIFAVIIHSI